MISRIDHVSLAVNDRDKAVHFFENILGAIPGADMVDDHLKFRWSIFSLGDLSRIEIISSSGEGSFLEGFLSDKQDGGIHHITVETPDIDAAMKVLDENNIPYFGRNDIGDVWRELFIHPKDAFGVLIQIAQFNPDDWLNDAVKFPAEKKWTVDKNDAGCCLTISHPGGGKASLHLTQAEMERLKNDLS